MKRGGTNVKAILLIMLILLQVGWAVPLAQPKSNQEIHQPNLYDPIYQVGEIHRDEGNYYINNFKIRIGKSQYDFSDYNEDGKFENIWEELWQLRGKKVVVEGHRSRNVEDYDHVFITSIKIIK